MNKILNKTNSEATHRMSQEICKRLGINKISGELIVVDEKLNKDHKKIPGKEVTKEQIVAHYQMLVESEKYGSTWG